MNAVVRILDWPIEADDALPLALWDAGSIARATGGQASTFFQVAGADIDIGAHLDRLEAGEAVALLGRRCGTGEKKGGGRTTPKGGAPKFTLPPSATSGAKPEFKLPGL